MKKQNSLPLVSLHGTAFNIVIPAFGSSFEEGVSFIFCNFIPFLIINLQPMSCQNLLEANTE